MRESAVERYLTGRVKSLGGLSYKWSSPSNRGVPDRVVILFSKIYFIELKSPTGKLSKLQDFVLDLLKKSLVNNPYAAVLVMYNKGDVDEFLRRCSKENAEML